jgi:hypothetical protein
MRPTANPGMASSWEEGKMRPSANTCICEYLKGKEDEAECKHTGICEYLRGGEDEAEREHLHLRAYTKHIKI